MSDTIAKDIIKHHGYLKGKRSSSYDRNWNAVSRYIFPTIRDPKTKGDSGNPIPECLDSEAAFDNVILSSAMYVSFTNQASLWFRMGLRDKPYDEMTRNEKANVQGAQKEIYRALQYSPFYKGIFTTWLTLTSFCTAGMYISDRDFDGILRVRTISPYDIFCEENWEEKVDTVIVPYRYTVRQILQRWPDAEKIGKLNREKEKNPYKEFNVLNFVGPADGSDWKVANKDHQFASIWVFEDGEFHLNPEKGGFEGDYEMPYLIPRWATGSGETYGTGPGIYSLPSIMSLQKVQEMDFEAIGLVINPPQKSTEGNIRAIGEDGELSPGCQIIVGDMDKTQPYITGANIPAAEMKVAKLQEQIQKFFFTQELLLSPDRPEMTAFETGKRIELMHRLLGPAACRGQNELLNPVIERVFGILSRASKSKRRMLKSAFKMEEIDIEYRSPLALLQKYALIQAANDLVNKILEIGAVYPSVIAKLNVSKYFDFIATHTGADMEVLNDDATYKKLEKAREDAQQQMMKLEFAEKAAGTAQRAARAEESLSRAKSSGQQPGNAPVQLPVQNKGR